MSRILRGMRATTHLFEMNRLKERLESQSREYLAIIRALPTCDRDGGGAHRSSRSQA